MEDLAAIPGINRQLVQKIYDFFDKEVVTITKQINYINNPI